MSDECTCNACGTCDERIQAKFDAARAAHYATPVGARAMLILNTICAAMGAATVGRNYPRSAQLGPLLWEQYSTGLHPTQRWCRADVGKENLLIGGRPSWLNPELPPDAFGFDGYAEPRGRIPA